MEGSVSMHQKKALEMRNPKPPPTYKSTQNR